MSTIAFDLGEGGKLRPWIGVIAFIDRYYTKFIVLAAIVASMAMLMISVLMAVNVLLRQVFDRSFVDTVMIGQISVVVLTFFGLAYTYRQGRHLSVRLLVDRAPWQMQLWIEVVCLLPALFALGIAVYYTAAFAHSSWVIGERLRGLIRIDAFPFHVMMPIGLGLLSIEVVRTIILDLAALITRRPELAKLAYDRRNESDRIIEDETVVQ